MEDALQLCIVNLDRFLSSPDSGRFWKDRSKYGVNETNQIDESVRSRFVRSLKRNMEERCGSDFPPIFYEAHQLLQPSRWKPSEFFSQDNSSTGIFAKQRATDIYNKNIDALTSSLSIKKQLEHCKIDTVVIQAEWQSLKSMMSRWEKTDFPPKNWESISDHLDENSHTNLFGLIDYLLCYGVSSADAERGFSIMKEIKTSKRALLANTHLCNQMRIKMDGPSIQEFDSNEAITHWFFKSNKKTPTVRSKRPTFGDVLHQNPGPKPKKKPIVVT
jgi:hypothetical protein